jgi:hypothetical protein
VLSDPTRLINAEVILPFNPLYRLAGESVQRSMVD